MSERLKRIFIGIGFIVIVIAMGAAIFLVFFRPAISPTVPTTPETPSDALNTGVLPGANDGPAGVVITTPNEPTVPVLPEADEIASGGLTQTTRLTTGSIEAPSISPDGSQVQFYDPRDGRFYKTTDDGSVEQLGNQRFPAVEEIIWDDNGSKAVLEFPDGANIVYDFESGTQATLPAHWEDFAFSPRTDELIAKSIGLDPNNRALVISNSDGSGAKAIAALGTNADKVQVNWSPNNQVVAFSDTGANISGVGRKMILPIGKNSENYKGLVVEGLNFEAEWNPSGDRVIYSVAGELNDYRPLLWVTDGKPNSLGENRRSLGIETWIDKCTFGAGNDLYCAVPIQLSSNAGLQRAIADNTPDNIYRINLDTGASELIAIPEDASTYSTLTVSGDSSTLYLQNANSGALEVIKLN